jgi:hypothetical protein
LARKRYYPPPHQQISRSLSHDLDLGAVIELKVVINTICGRDAAVELTGMYLQRVLKVTFSSIQR